MTLSHSKIFSIHFFPLTKICIKRTRAGIERVSERKSAVSYGQRGKVYGVSYFNIWAHIIRNNCYWNINTCFNYATKLLEWVYNLNLSVEIYSVCLRFSVYYFFSNKRVLFVKYHNICAFATLNFTFSPNVRRHMYKEEERPSYWDTLHI